MNALTKLLRADTIFFWCFYGSLGLLLIALILIVVFYTKLPPVIPIFQQLPWGYDRLGTKETIFIPLGISLLLFVVNFLFSAMYYERLPLVARMLSTTAFLISFFACTITIRLLLLII
jgi:hypothetical protein